MKKALYTVVMIFWVLSCSKDEPAEGQKKGVIENRPRITVDSSTQVDLKFADIMCSAIDTSLHFSQAISDSLEAHLDYIKQKGHYKGLSVSMGIPGKGFWKSVVGESGTDVSLTTETKFHAMSLGKIFTSALVLKLIEEGRLGLNDTIDRWFPDCPRANQITVTHLLSHTSGIQTYEVLYEFVLNNRNDFNEQDLVDMAEAYPIDYSPDSYIAYTNTGYIMLGMIMESLTGHGLEELFDTYYIKPLNLRNTLVNCKANLAMENIRGYDGETLSNNTEWPLTYAAGPFISTPTEILLIYDYILSGQFLKESSVNTMLSDMNIWLYSPDSYYGKGIYLFKGLPSGDYLGHSGGDGPFRTCVYYNIDRRVFVSIFSNSNSMEIEPAMFHMSETLMNLLD